MLELKQLSVGYPERIILEEINLTLNTGELIGIIGPNGSGKSTLLKTIYQASKPLAGTIYLQGTDLEDWKLKDIFQQLAVVGQENEVPFDFSVEDIVAMGRNPYKNYFQKDSPNDKRIVLEALKKIGMEERRKESFQHLSGGEKQRVILARALTQQTPLLLLDEPTNHLDIFYQIQIFDLLKELQLTVVSAIHDLNIASLYCDRLIILNDGFIFADGKPEDVLKEEIIYQCFNITCSITIHPITNKKNITFLPNYVNNKTKRGI